MGFGLDKKGNQPRDLMEDHVWANLFVAGGMTALDCEPRGTPPTAEEAAERAADQPRAEASNQID